MATTDLRQRMYDYEGRWGRVPVNADYYDPDARIHITFAQLAELEAIARDGAGERERAAKVADAYGARVREVLVDAERNAMRAQGEAQILRAVVRTAEDIAAEIRTPKTEE